MDMFILLKINVKTYQFKAHCKGDSHSSTANRRITLPGLTLNKCVLSYVHRLCTYPAAYVSASLYRSKYKLYHSYNNFIGQTSLSHTQVSINECKISTRTTEQLISPNMNTTSLVERAWKIKDSERDSRRRYINNLLRVDVTNCRSESLPCM